MTPAPRPGGFKPPPGILEHRRGEAGYAVLRLLGPVAHTVSGPEECRRPENLLENEEPGPVECRYEEAFLEPS